MAKSLKSSRKSNPEESFFERVYAVVRMIPAGRVTTYGAIARCIGSPQAARMVGWAMNASHAFPGFLPAHRVINRNGLLSGKHHFRHENLMQELLESEGIRIEDDRVVDLKKHFWDPYQELV